MTTSATTTTRPKNYSALRRHLQALAVLPVTAEPVLSIYLDLRTKSTRLKFDFQRWAKTARTTIDPERRPAFDAAAADVESAIGHAWPSTIRSLAIFARAGDTPLLMSLPFAAQLETAFHADVMPVIFPLVQMKDRFHRFVVVVGTEEYVRIHEITLGAVSEKILATRPEIRKRIGREWTREHYHQHKHDASRRFLKDQVNLVAGLMAKRGMNHLILAGPPKWASAMRAALPKLLQDRVVETLYHTPQINNCSQVLEEAISSFIEHEQDESRGTVERLHENVRRNGLAVVGFGPSRDAISQGIASQLIISEQLPVDEREELVRLATSLELPIEVCENDELLDSHGGVGCLLRYRPHD